MALFDNQKQGGFQFDDPDSVTRSGRLSVVSARAEAAAPFDRGLFAGFSRMRALTYTSSVPMILGLLRDYDFDDFECVFGYGGVLSRGAADILAFQSVMTDKLNAGFVGLGGAPPERVGVIYDRAADGKARFYVVKDAIAHAKIYLLEREGGEGGGGVPRTRVIVGSANLSETAFSGRQAETLVKFDDDPIAWEHYSAQYEAARGVSVSRLPITDRRGVQVKQASVEDTPALADAAKGGDGGKGVTLYVPLETDEEGAYSAPAVISAVERVKPVFKRALADIRPDKSGAVRFTPKVVSQIRRVVLSRQADDVPQTYLALEGGRFIMSGAGLSLDVDPDEVRRDAANWLRFFGNYERGFKGDVPRLQKDYFTFMCWFYFSPFMCDLRSAALRRDAFNFDQPMFAVLYGASHCGKTSLINTLMASMFNRSHLIGTSEFTPGKLRGLQGAYKRFPIVFDDVTRDRFSRSAPEVIKDETIPYSEYPCFALSMNAETRSFPPEIVKRCLMIYTRTMLPGTEVAEQKRLTRSVARIRSELTTALYREYLKRALAEMDAVARSDADDADALEISSSILCDIFSENLPDGESAPDWLRGMTLKEYKERAFDRPRERLKDMLSGDRYSRDRMPPDGCWTLSGDRIIVGAPVMGAARIRAEIPDWLLDDSAGSAGQIALRRELAEDFLGEAVKAPRRWFFARG